MNRISAYVRLLGVMLTAVLLFSACDEENYYVRDRLLGSWQVVEVEGYGAPYYPGDVFYFDRHNRFEAFLGDFRYSGSYRVTREYDGDVITVWFDDSPGYPAFAARVDALGPAYTRWYVTDYENNRRYTLRLVAV